VDKRPGRGIEEAQAGVAVGAIVVVGSSRPLREHDDTPDCRVDRQRDGMRGDGDSVQERDP